MRKLLLALILLATLPLSAARSFDGSTDHLVIDVAVVSGTPLSMCGWFFNADSGIGVVTIATVQDKDVADMRHILQLRGNTAGDPVGAFSQDAGGSPAVESTTGTTVNTWHHACGVWATSTSRIIYLDGGSKAEDTTSVSPVGLDRTSIGRNMDSTPSGPFNGRIAEVGIWDVALTDAEVAILGAGFSPLLVRSQNLVAYWPLIGRVSPEIELISGNDLTVVTPGVVAHSPIIYPTQPISGFAAAAVPPAGKRRAIIISEMLKYAPAPILAGGLGLAWVINRRNKLMRGR